MKQYLRTVCRVIFYAFVLTLPLTILAILQAVVNATYLGWYMTGQVSEGTAKLLSEIGADADRDYWNVPGTITFSDYMDNGEPYYIPPLKTDNWLSKLHFRIPKAHMMTEASVDKLASVEYLMRDVVCTPNLPTDYWVYASHGWPDLFPFDQAFDELLQYQYANPLGNDYNITYVDCNQAPFLCHVWGLRAPALVKFTVKTRPELDNQADGEAPQAQLEYNGDADHLVPIDVRIIDLPLSIPRAPIIPCTLPSEFEQLRSIVYSKDFHKELDDYSTSGRMLEVYWNHYWEPLCERRGTAIYYLIEADSWVEYHILKPLGLADVVQTFSEIVYNIHFVIAVSVSALVRLIQDGFSWFLGKPSAGDMFDAKLPESTFMGDMFGGFLEAFMWNLTQSNNSHPVTTMAEITKG